MFKKRCIKIAFVLACIISLIMPYTSTVLAAALTQEDTTAELQVLVVHKGGEESSGTLTEEQLEYYDTAPYGFHNLCSFFPCKGHTHYAPILIQNRNVITEIVFPTDFHLA